MCAKKPLLPRALSMKAVGRRVAASPLGAHEVLRMRRERRGKRRATIGPSQDNGHSIGAVKRRAVELAVRGDVHRPVIATPGFRANLEIWCGDNTTRANRRIVDPAAQSAAVSAFTLASASRAGYRDSINPS